jgi:signal transduction histidine kinase
VSFSAQAMAELRPDDPECAELASQIVSSAHAAGQMLTDFLDFAVSRLGCSMPVAPVPMDLAALCHEVIAEVRTGSSHVRWHFETAGDLRGAWDRARLRQLLSNLISNAVHHGDAGSIVSVSAHGEGDEVMLRVHNSGPPIPAAILPRIFDPLVRGSEPSSGDRRIGLGLYIAHEVVVAHGGRIEVTSTQEDGTAFTITLPRSASARR